MSVRMVYIWQCCVSCYVNVLVLSRVLTLFGEVFSSILVTSYDCIKTAFTEMSSTILFDLPMYVYVCVCVCVFHNFTNICFTVKDISITKSCIKIYLIGMNYLVVP